MRRESDFLKAAQETGKNILELQDVVVIHHFDADGIPGGAIIFSALFRNGVAPAMVCWKKMTEKNLQELKNRSEKNVVFCDLGAGYLSTLEQALGNKKVFVIDHHEPEKPPEQRAKNFTVINPHDYGLDGANEASGGATAYLCFRQYKELSQLALVSAVGDSQDKNGLKGINKDILSDAVQSGEAIVKKDLRIFGKSSRSLISFLSYCAEPFLPGLTGDDKACARFLFENNIPYKRENRSVSYYDLEDDEKKRFTSALIEHCLAQKVEEKKLKELIGDVYIFPKEEKGTPFYDCQEYAALVNACGRNEAGDIGVGACLRNADHRKKAREILNRHRQNLRSGIILARKKTSDLGEFSFLDARDQIKDGIIGIVASAVIGNANKPVIAVASDCEDAGMLKISTRANDELVAKGVDLNAMLREATQGLGKSFGGGHKVAAGASVEKLFLPEFLKKCAEILKEQREKGEKNE